ncbi:MAG: carbohydrate binding family 9 domain-containing protein [Chitinophagaceae bacterium]|nr:carbohydrate binding family 9 domain-containing protein [Chitinophagaceae bacterium]
MSHAPKIDGILDDEAWRSAYIANEFITNTPNYGNPATDSTIVKIVYDNTAIYIGAHLYGNPTGIRKQFTPRDQERLADVDNFAVFIDSYHDRQNAFQFLVTPRNVQSDARVSANVIPENGVFGELSWDAVWDSRVSIHENGWSVEMLIPLSTLRFSKKQAGEWGIQFMRFSRKDNETSFWNPVDPNMSGFVNQFGIIDGFDSIAPPLRLSFSPYVSGGYRETPVRIPEGTQTEWLKSGGMDVKYGISESFTLDATLIPDFGQVISDNVINNISPFEIQFRENRPFFTEGTELFNKADIFYSRRVGSEPTGYQGVIDSVGTGSLTNYDILKNPTLTRLYNAIKFSGRTKDNLGIGIFNSVARSERAKIRNTLNGSDSTILTEELANYNVFVLDKALKNRSYITLTNTNVIRNGEARDANVTGVDLALYDKRNLYGLVLKPRYSRIFQKNGGYDGFKNYIELGKVSGKFQYFISNDLKTDKYDPNDLGFLLSPNEVNTIGNVSYNIYQPTQTFLNQQYSFTVGQSYLYKPFEYQRTEIIAIANWTFHNFWTLNLEAGSYPSWSNDFFELQTPASNLETPRQKLRRAPYHYLFMRGTTDNRRRLFITWNLGGAEGQLPDNPFYKVAFEARYRFSDRLTLTASYFRQHDHGQFGYSFIRDNLTQAPILARRQYTDVTSIVSGIYNFTPRMNLTFRARHFWNRILNTNLYDVTPDGNWMERLNMLASDYNVNYNVFNLDAFFTWDFRLGSRVILAWKNSLGQDYEGYISGTDFKSYSQNARRIFNIPHGNEVTLRFIYFLDYQQLKKIF